ncbi:MAG: type I restriction-modification system subunit M N-terminal domain-containing protein, partial [Candidatus Delongbacteria bacterium]
MANNGSIGFEEKLWLSADKLRNNLDPAEYKHVVLGLIFLKYISDTFEERYAQLVNEDEGFEEDRDEYSSENIFWVPEKSRWKHLQNNAKKPEIGMMIDEAMIEIEKENISLKGVLNKNYGRPDLDKRRLGELVDLMS